MMWDREGRRVVDAENEGKKKKRGYHMSSVKNKRGTEGKVS